MAADVEVEAAESVVAEGVGATLQDDGSGPVYVDSGADDVLEKVGVGFVVDAIVEGHVDGKISSWVVWVDGTSGFKWAGAREEDLFVVFVEGDAHDAIGGPEGLFDAVTVVDVDIDVEDTGVVTKELKDCEDNVVDVAEPGCFALFSVV